MPDFTQTITETWTGDSGTINSTQSITIGSITDVFKRVVTIEANQDVILANFDANVSDGAIVNLDVENIKYVRVTNLDSDDVTITLDIDANADGSETAAMTYRLEQNQSFVLWDTDASIGVHDSAHTVITSLGDVFSITMNPGSNAGKVEIVAAATVVS